ncbi:uncharacterized protein [Dysidea avara]|uniref:uncharacterized protein isoform X1 n=1 Tax=Dysidea avara TaxID=196820 RepID=UPI00332023D6
MTDIEGLVTLGKDYNSRPEEREFQTFLTVHCHYWRRIGLNLRLKPTVLDVVAADHVTVRERFRVVLCNWLLLQGDNATWHHLEIAITNARREELGLNPLTNRAVETVLESQSIQPVAVVDTLADDGVDDLLSNVKPKSIQELEVKFAKVTNRIKQQVFNHPRINPMSLIEQLRTVSAVRDQHVPLLDEDVFTRVTTMEQLWRKLTNYWTIYNYDIF